MQTSDRHLELQDRVSGILTAEHKAYIDAWRTESMQGKSGMEYFFCNKRKVSTIVKNKK
jgi:hypothetical protein